MAGEYITLKDAAGSASDAKRDVQLSPLALRQLSTGYVFDKSVPIFEPRENIPIADCTSLECTMLLQKRGWEWKLFPKRIEERKKLVHLTSEARGSFYTLGKTLIHSYLMCLLQAEDLREPYGLEAIQHYAEKPSDFDGLLKGEPIKYKEPRTLLQIDDGDADVRLAIADEAQLEKDAEEEEEHVSDEYADLMNYLEEALEQELLVLALRDEAEKAKGGPDAEVEDEANNVPDEGGVSDRDDEGNGGEGIVTPTGSIGDDGGIATPTGDIGDIAGEGIATPPLAVEVYTVGLKFRQKLKFIPWGVFTIARKVTADGATSFEARCTFHKKSADTGCKKTVQYNAATESHALGALKWWCNEARNHTRQSSHVAAFDELIEVPFLPHDVLLSQQIVEQPPAQVKTDLELDAEYFARRGNCSRKVAHDRRAAGEVGRSRGRGRGRPRGGRGRGARAAGSHTSAGQGRHSSAGQDSSEMASASSASSSSSSSGS